MSRDYWEQGYQTKEQAGEKGGARAGRGDLGGDGRLGGGGNLRRVGPDRLRVRHGGIYRQNKRWWRDLDA